MLDVDSHSAVITIYILHLHPRNPCVPVDMSGAVRTQVCAAVPFDWLCKLENDRFDVNDHLETQVQLAVMTVELIKAYLDVL